MGRCVIENPVEGDEGGKLQTRRSRAPKSRCLVHEVQGGFALRCGGLNGKEAVEELGGLRDFVLKEL